MPTPPTMVATVGMNPLPVALAILTRKPERVLLAPSAQTKDEAMRVRRLIQQLRPEIEFLACATCGKSAQTLYCDEDADCLGVGDAAEFGPTLAALDRMIPEQVAREGYLLDYSGGNKIMAVSAIWKHLEHHAGGWESWRSVVDDSVGQVVSGSNEAGGGRMEVDSRGLDLVNMAALHGYDLRPDYRGFAPEGLAARLWDLMTQVDNRQPEEILEDALIERWQGIVRELLSTPEASDQFHKAMAAFLGHVDKHGNPRRWRVGEVVGKLRELAVWAKISDMLRGYPGEDIEVMLGATPQLSGQTVADFDVAIRRGHRVAEIECKSNARAASDVLGQRTAFARLVFGSATAAAIAAPEGTAKKGQPQVHWGAVEATSQRIQRHAAWVGKVPLWRLDTEEPATDVLAWLFGSGRRIRAARGSGQSSVGGFVVPAVGTPLAVHAAIRSLDRRGNSEQINGIGNDAGSAAFRKWSGARSGYVRLEDFSEHAVYSRIDKKTLSGVIITPGPKAIAAGLTRAAFDQRAAVMHVDLHGRRHRMDGPVENSAHEPAWPEVLGSEGDSEPRYVAVDQCSDPVVAPFADALSKQLPDRSQFWQPVAAASGEGDVAAKLLITGPRGCCSVHVLDLTRTKARKPADRQKDIRHFRFDVLSRSADVTALVGDLHRPLLLLHNVLDYRDLSDPVAATRFSADSDAAPDPVWARWTRAERWLALGLWSPSPDGVSVLVDVPELRSHLFGPETAND